MRLPLFLATLALSGGLAFGLAGQIGNAQLGYRTDIDEASKKKVSQALKFMNEKMTFIEGSFFNEFTNFTLGGTMDNAASCIWLIREVGIWKVEARASDFGNADTVLSVAQDSGSGKISIGINNGHKDYHREDFAKFLDAEPELIAPGAKIEIDFSLQQLQSLLNSLEPCADAEAKGRELAIADIASDRKRIFVFGMRRVVEEPEIDELSGLPVVSAAGCCVSEPFVKAVAAYNAVMRENAAR